jgi:hypothetical protein
MSIKPLDVIVVPDFTGKSHRLFEIRTLFFLASWLETDSYKSHCPLHVACIGEPPKSVCWLAEKCSAAITVHEPLLTGGFYNKLRGLEIKGTTAHGLLLDVDIILLANISSLASLLASNCISAAVENDAHLCNSQWIDIYANFGINPPQERISTLNAMLKGYIPSERGCDESATSAFPYYNAGVISFPWKCGLELRNLWEDSIEKIKLILNEESQKGIEYVKRAFSSNQPALAITIELLKQQGYQFGYLPNETHTRWQHIYLGLVNFEQIKLIHTIGSFRRIDSKIDSSKGFGNHVIRNKVIKAFIGEVTYESAYFKTKVWQRLFKALRVTYQIDSKVKDLYNKWVRLALNTPN